jgi:hypothetical protein
MFSYQKPPVCYTKYVFLSINKPACTNSHGDSGQNFLPVKNQVTTQVLFVI